MANVTWRGLILITDAEGVWETKPGVFTRETKFVRPPRSIGGRVKDLGADGAEHSLELTFLNVVDPETIKTRLENLHCPPSGQIQSGTLVIPKAMGATMHSFPHCVFTGLTFNSEEIRADFTSPNTYTDVWDLSFTLTFRQTRMG